MKKMVMVWLFALLGIFAYAQETISPEVFYAQPSVSIGIFVLKILKTKFRLFSLHLSKREKMGWITILGKMNY
jgi:hypothetical protein